MNNIMKNKNNLIELIILTAIAIILLVAFFSVSALNKKTAIDLRKFASYNELSAFIKSHSDSSYTQFGALGINAPETSSTTKTSEYGANDYSTTNIQVAGVDEPDIVKTDGKYIYTVSDGKVIIIDAYPAEKAANVSKIELNWTASQIFVNGNKLIIFGAEKSYYKNVGISLKEDAAIKAPYYSEPKTMVAVYNTEDRSNPVLEKEIAIDGNLFQARMINDYVYIISIQPIYFMGQGPILPAIKTNEKETVVSPDKIEYFDSYDISFVYNNIVALNIKNTESTIKTFLTGYSQNMYMSKDNLYLTHTKQISQNDIEKRLIEKALLPNIPADIQQKILYVQRHNASDYEKQIAIQVIVKNYAEDIGPEQGAMLMKKIDADEEQIRIEIEKESEKTIIHKISVSGNNIEYKATVEIPGRVLNQFSMDEYENNFRIATTTGNGDRSLNHLHIIDSSMNIIGKIENIAQKEQIYSVRFMDKKAYFVTFKRTDPLFVLDLSDSKNPKILGELKLPGFSEYLHPYDENHIIGLGMETDDTGRTTGEIKIVLFDIKDPSNPKLMHSYLIGGNGSYVYSEALNDHKAFLFDKQKSLLVIPVNINDWRKSYYNQGAYVFDLSLDNGFYLKGIVTHFENKTQDKYYYGDYFSTIRRSLYINEILYTVSENFVKANKLNDLSVVSSINIGLQRNVGPIIY